MKTLHIKLKSASYPIFLEQKCSVHIAEYLLEQNLPKNICIITNETIAPLHLKTFLGQFSDGFRVSTYVIKDHESEKSLTVANKIYTHLIEQTFTRDTLIIAFGGGVVGDLSGFIAATYYRGVPFIQVPTTLLSQVDSSVGGKVAVNHTLGKNLIGAFYQPKAVFIDTQFIKTLPKRELICGLGEVIKYGYISSQQLLTFVKENIESIFKYKLKAIEQIIEQCIQIKLHVVQEDELETGIRAILNFGHTFGHAIEAADGYETVKHGEAVIAGMICALKLSAMFSENSAFNYPNEKQFLESLYTFPNTKKFTSEQLYTLMSHDKKNINNKINFIVIQDIEHAYKSSDFDEESILYVLNEIL